MDQIAFIPFALGIVIAVPSLAMLAKYRRAYRAIRAELRAIENERPMIGPGWNVKR